MQTPTVKYHSKSQRAQYMNAFITDGHYGVQHIGLYGDFFYFEISSG